MIIGSQCQLVLSHWLPSVLQTDDQRKRTDNFVYINIAFVTAPWNISDPSSCAWPCKVSFIIVPLLLHAVDAFRNNERKL